MLKSIMIKELFYNECVTVSKTKHNTLLRILTYTITCSASRHTLASCSHLHNDHRKLNIIPLAIIIPKKYIKSP